MSDQSKKQQPKQKPSTGKPEKRSHIGDSSKAMENLEKAAEIPPKTGSGSSAGSKKTKE